MPSDIDELVAAINRNTAALLTVAAFTAKAAGLGTSQQVPAPTRGVVRDLFDEFVQLVARLSSQP
jgi:hypothetical protein